jgi:hypothetical protein
MELTRRDAVAALAALGVAGGVGVGIDRLGRRGGNGNDPDPPPEDTPVDETRLREVFVAAAAVVYPSEVSGTEPFVETFLAGRLDHSDHAAGLREAVGTLDERARSWHGEHFAALSPADRDSLLREVGADTAEEDPTGTAAERIRYHVVNELLLALYASPTGGQLVGIENPQGHPGGIESYQRGP